jgi:hypothetical protein
MQFFVFPVKTMIRITNSFSQVFSDRYDGGYFRRIAQNLLISNEIVLKQVVTVIISRYLLIDNHRETSVTNCY